MTVTIESVASGDEPAIAAVRRLWTAYWDSFGFAPGFQGFDEELRTLPGCYAAPAGCLLLARVDGEEAGTAAFRPLGPASCEAKRLFVHPRFRGRGLAGQLLRRLIGEARARGARAIFGDTLPSMASALALYRDLGFVEVEPYSDTPTPGAVYLRLDLP